MICLISSLINHLPHWRLRKIAGQLLWTFITRPLIDKERMISWNRGTYEQDFPTVGYA